MTLITRKKMGEEAQIQRKTVRLLRELLEDNRQQGVAKRLGADTDCAQAGPARLQVIRKRPSLRRTEDLNFDVREMLTQLHSLTPEERAALIRSYAE